MGAVSKKSCNAFMRFTLSACMCTPCTTEQQVTPLLAGSQVVHHVAQPCGNGLQSLKYGAQLAQSSLPADTDTR